MVTGIYWSYTAHSACETVPCLFHNAFSPFNLVPLPSGLQPFLFKGISRKHERQHPPEPKKEGWQHHAEPRPAEPAGFGLAPVPGRGRAAGEGVFYFHKHLPPPRRRSPGEQPQPLGTPRGGCPGWLPGLRFRMHLRKFTARYVCAPWSSSRVAVTSALKVLFSLGIRNSENCFHLRLRTLFPGGFAEVAGGGKGEAGASPEHYSVSLKNLIREIYEQCEIHGQPSVNFV